MSTSTSIQTAAIERLLTLPTSKKYICRHFRLPVPFRTSNPVALSFRTSWRTGSIRCATAAESYCLFLLFSGSLICRFIDTLQVITTILLGVIVYVIRVTLKTIFHDSFQTACRSRVTLHAFIVAATLTIQCR